MIFKITISVHLAQMNLIDHTVYQKEGKKLIANNLIQVQSRKEIISKLKK